MIGNFRLPSCNSEDPEVRKKSYLLTRIRSKVRNIDIDTSVFENMAKDAGLSAILTDQDQEYESNMRVHEVCDFIDKYHRYPSSHSNNNNKERHLGYFLIRMRSIKNGKRKSIFYISNQQIAEERGYPDLFKFVDREAVSNGRVHEVCDFIDKYGKKPSPNSKDTKEKALARFLISKRKAKSENKAFYLSDQKIVEQRGYPDIFDRIDREPVSNKKTIKVCDFIDKHGKRPSLDSKDLIEIKLAKHVRSKRRAKAGLKGIFHTSDQKIAESRGYPKLFELYRPEYESNVNVHAVCDFIDKHGRKPYASTRLGRFLVMKRSAKHGKNKSKFYASDQQIAQERGYPLLFETREEESNRVLNKVCDFIDTNNRAPSGSSKNVEELRLARFIQGKRCAKSGTSKKDKLYSSNKSTIKARGYPQLFDKGWRM